MADSAQGIDVSSFQAVLTAVTLDGLVFCFTKATEGSVNTDGNFARNWAAMKAKGTHRGAYHELWTEAAAPVAAQAAHFLAVVKAAGLEKGDMLAVVASDYPGVSTDEVKTFADTIHAAEPECPVLIYTDLDVAKTLTSCTGYGLWVAWPSDTAPPSVTPWATWRLWQWGQASATDRDAYNGTQAEFETWLESASTPPVPVKPVVTKADAENALAVLTAYIAG
jgi:GH25 family lysozyme M1 (1,4-beta-N-acetylmuramidase)